MVRCCCDGPTCSTPGQELPGDGYRTSASSLAPTMDGQTADEMDSRRDRVLATVLRALGEAQQTGMPLTVETARLASVAAGDPASRDALSSRDWVVTSLAMFAESASATLSKQASTGVITGDATSDGQKAVGHAACALRRLLLSPAACAALFKSRGLPCIASMLRHSRSHYTITSALLCLARLVDTRGNGSERAGLYALSLVDTTDTPSLLADALCGGAQSPVALEAAAAAAAGLARIPQCRQALVRAGCVEAMSPYVGAAGSSTPRARRSMLDTLSDIAAPVPVDANSTELGAESQQRALRVAGCCTAALVSCLAAGTPPSSQAGTQALPTATAGVEDDPSVRAGCARLLARLAQHPPCQALLTRDGALEAVSTALSSVREELKALGEGCCGGQSVGELESALADAVRCLAAQRPMRKQLRKDSTLVPTLKGLAKDRDAPPAARAAAGTALHMLHPVTATLLAVPRR